MSAARPIAMAFRSLRRAGGLAGGCQAAALALGLIPDFLNEALVALDAKLNHDVNQQIEQILDIGPSEALAAAALLHQQHQLLEGQFRTGRVHARDRAWV